MRWLPVAPNCAFEVDKLGDRPISLKRKVQWKSVAACLRDGVDAKNGVIRCDRFEVD